MVGKNKDEFVTLAEKEYLKRLQPFLSINLVIIPSNKINPKAEVEKVKNFESEKILKRIPDISYTIALDEKGKSFSSTEFANHFSKLLVSQSKPIFFIIGGPYGHSEKLKEQCNEMISLFKNDLNSPDGENYSIRTNLSGNDDN